MSIKNLEAEHGAFIHNDVEYHSISCVGFRGIKYTYDTYKNVTGSYTNANKSVNLWIKNVKRCL